jgi:hypothetical protein
MQLLFAQEKKIAFKEAKVGPDTGEWYNTMELGVNFNQATFSPNWKGGGVNSYSVGGLLNLATGYDKKRFSYEGKINAQYGLQKVQKQSARKTIDVLLGDVKFAYLFSKDWSGFIGANLITQFDKGYEYGEDSLNNETKTTISNFFAPAYLTLPVGIQYKPNKNFFARFGLASLRYTFVTDNEVRKNVEGNYGVDTNSTYLRQFGMQIISGYNKDITKTINFKANYFGFFDYERINVSDFVHRLDIVFSAKVTKYINTTFSAIMFFDKTQDKDVQFNQVLNVGFLVKLGSVDEKKE